MFYQKCSGKEYLVWYHTPVHSKLFLSSSVVVNASFVDATRCPGDYLGSYSNTTVFCGEEYQTKCDLTWPELGCAECQNVVSPTKQPTSWPTAVFIEPTGSPTETETKYPSIDHNNDPQQFPVDSFEASTKRPTTDGSATTPKSYLEGSTDYECERYSKK